MKKLWSKFWNSSIQRRKQRKYNHNAPLHIKHKFMASPLNIELKKKYNIRSVPVKKGDVVEIMSGDFKKQSGKVARTSLAKTRIYIEGAEKTKADGSKVMYPIHPSNVQIKKLNVTDKLRVKKIERARQKK